MRSAALADTLGRLALYSPLAEYYCKKDLVGWLKEVVAGGNDVKNPLTEERRAYL